MIKLIAFDFDGVLTPFDSPSYVLRKLGEKKEADSLPLEYYSGMAAAKIPEEREEVVRRIQNEGFDKLKLHPLSEIEKFSTEIAAMNGAKETFIALRKRGIRIAVLSATVRFIVEKALETNGMRADFIFCSEHTIENGHFGNLTYVLTPLEKRKKLAKLLSELKISPKECIAVGDSLSEEYMFELVGKENSVAFNYKPELGICAGNLLFPQGSGKCDMMEIMKTVDSKRE